MSISVLTKRLLIIITTALLISLVFLFVFYKNRITDHTPKTSPLPSDTGAIGDLFTTPDGVLDLMDTRTRIVSTQEPPDRLFPESSARIKIGFYDSSGDLHIYPARIGGSLPDGTLMRVSLCTVGSNGQPSCVATYPEEVVNNLSKNQLVTAQIVFGVRAQWEGGEQLKSYQRVIEELKNALIRGKDFPKSPDSEDFVIQVWGVTLD